jgi:Tol biopolymer transport system component
VIGSRLGPYQITAKLGEGGMGEVYRATDTKLDRQVAIKVLPAAFIEDKERLARFEREAKLLAQLHHPNIASIFGLEESDGTRALVMELVEGPTLAERLEQGPLPFNESLSVSLQIAHALEEAHEKGIVHRDLKPQNIKASIEGKVKVLDFGLAKAMDPMGAASGGPGSASQLAVSPTLTLGATQMGMILGTAAYMAPEQAKGLAVDKRADIWAFGVVLYEMLTGRRLFDAPTVPETLAHVLTREPDLGTLPASTPRAMVRLLRRCLERNPKNRMRDVGDARMVIEEIAAGGEASETAAASATAATPRWRSALPWILAAAASLAAAATFVASQRRAEAPARAIRASILPPAGLRFSTSPTAPSPLALSPDGRFLAFSARQGEGADLLWIQELESGSVRSLDGTEGASQPFWSADGKSLGFFADRTLKRVDSRGGPVITLASAADPRGGSWSADGTILFSPLFESPILRVSADGGETKAVSVLDETVNESTHRYPFFLPDGRHFLYLARRAGAGAGESPVVYAGSIDAPGRKAILNVASNVLYASGHLLYVRQGVLVAQRFDADRLHLVGDAVPIAADVRMNERYSRAAFTVSTTGLLAYQTGKLNVRNVLLRMDRAGREIATVGEPGELYDDGRPTLSPDGRRAAISILNEQGISSIWIVNTETGVRSRFTLDGTDHASGVWSPDGSRLAFDVEGASERRIVAKAIDGSGVEEEWVSRQVRSLEPSSVSPDGRALLFEEETALGSRNDLWVLPLDGSGRASPLARTAANEQHGQFSPNGRFVAYVSDESGRDEVYVASYPPPGDRWQVSQGSGREPRWSRTGRELFFFDRENWLRVATVDTTGARFEVLSTEKLFQVASRGSNYNFRYDVFPDGREFLVGTPADEALESPFTLVTDWPRRVEER